MASGRRLAVVGAALWVTGCTTGGIARLDPLAGSGSVSEIDAGLVECQAARLARERADRPNDGGPPSDAFQAAAASILEAVSPASRAPDLPNLLVYLFKDDQKAEERKACSEGAVNHDPLVVLMRDREAVRVLDGEPVVWLVILAEAAKDARCPEVTFGLTAIGETRPTVPTTTNDLFGAIIQRHEDEWTASEPLGLTRQTHFIGWLRDGGLLCEHIEHLKLLPDSLNRLRITTPADPDEAGAQVRVVDDIRVVGHEPQPSRGAEGTALHAPTIVSATPGLASVRLTWTASPGAQFYVISKETEKNGPGYQEVARTTDTSHTIDGLVHDEPVRFVVQAGNETGASGCSSPVQVTPRKPRAQTNSYFYFSNSRFPHYGGSLAIGSSLLNVESGHWCINTGECTPSLYAFAFAYVLQSPRPQSWWATTKWSLALALGVRLLDPAFGEATGGLRFALGQTWSGRLSRFGLIVGLTYPFRTSDNTTRTVATTVTRPGGSQTTTAHVSPQANHFHLFAALDFAF